MDNIFPAFHKKWRGKQYCLPIETGPAALFYNTEIFKKAGIAGPPKTWDEYAAVARKCSHWPESVLPPPTALHRRSTP